MKKTIFAAVSLLIMLVVVAMSAYSGWLGKNILPRPPMSQRQKAAITEKRDVRKSVWQQLSSAQKEWVEGTWQGGAVSTVTVQGALMIGVDDPSYEGKDVYMVAFPTKNKIIGNLLVLADMETFDLIGFAPID